MKINYKELEDKVYNFPTKYSEGFLQTEVAELIKEFPTITLEEFSEKLGVHTAMSTEDGTITYHSDVLLGITCSLQKRSINSLEFD